MIQKTILAVTVLALAAVVVPAADEPAATKTVLEIQGMVCGDCAAKVKAKLDETEGVLQYEVNPKEGEAEIAYDPDKTSPDQIAAAVSETGFKARVKGEKTG